jgi:hypothetical protein
MATLTHVALAVGAWVQICSDVEQYAGMVGPIDWIDLQHPDEPYGVDLHGESRFFAAGELTLLPGKPAGDPRLTRVVTLDGTDYLMIGLTEAELVAQEMEIQESCMDSVSLKDAQAILANPKLWQTYMDGLLTAHEAARLCYR